MITLNTIKTVLIVTSIVGLSACGSNNHRPTPTPTPDPAPTPAPAPSTPDFQAMLDDAAGDAVIQAKQPVGQ